MAHFLSPQWFQQVAELTEAAGDLDIPRAMREVVVNLAIETAEGPVALCMDRGIIRVGRAEKPDVEMSMPEEYAWRILVAGDWSAGMQGYVARRIRLSGNLRKLIPLQIHRPSEAGEALRRQIERITDEKW
jgi:hypothetical protein